MAIRTDDATDPDDPRPIIRIVASVEISGEWITSEMIAYAARQFADSIAAKLRAAADEQPGPVEPDDEFARREQDVHDAVHPGEQM
jgi:hypothetical protein